ncbi:hypothetical protein GQ600_9146 [Phytophthora cactorum]|nr:hypothetical protein GQ600_9146 [Phytophthora cactorum]
MLPRNFWVHSYKFEEITQSVVRVSLEDVCLGTALVVDRTPTHLYLLTNLYTWIDKDETFMNHMSADFKKEIKRYLKLNPRMKQVEGKEERRSCNPAKS